MGIGDIRNPRILLSMTRFFPWVQRTQFNQSIQLIQLALKYVLLSQKLIESKSCWHVQAKINMVQKVIQYSA